MGPYRGKKTPGQRRDDHDAHGAGGMGVHESCGTLMDAHGGRMRVHESWATLMDAHGAVGGKQHREPM